ncbi:Acrosin [Eumeta japonica]|uniref:Acrosin n=1 Tax=Eumeta variegata TaxID=151549 RepID=A0A4C1YB91_EUMVA|nr:Acrosin [Eumeta japonica]
MNYLKLSAHASALTRCNKKIIIGFNDAWESSKCGERKRQGQKAGQRIVSGWLAQPGQIPWQFSLRMVDGSGAVFSCGGSIVHREWGISAAHCPASGYLSEQSLSGFAQEHTGTRMK